MQKHDIDNDNDKNIERQRKKRQTDRQIETESVNETERVRVREISLGTVCTFIAHLLLNKIKSNTEEQEQTKGISESGCVHTCTRALIVVSLHIGLFVSFALVCSF